MGQYKPSVSTGPALGHPLHCMAGPERGTQHSCWMHSCGPAQPSSTSLGRHPPILTYSSRLLLLSLLSLARLGFPGWRRVEGQHDSCWVGWLLLSLCCCYGVKQGDARQVVGRR